MKEGESTNIKPFVKWVGGKRQLLPAIVSVIPERIAGKSSIVYVEPFVGGGAVLLYMLEHFSNIETAVINDQNQKLIQTYSVVKNDVESLIESLSRISEEYLVLDSASRTKYFLELRDKFNREKMNDVELAACFVFLNKTCFNGLYRENSKGEFNTPHGKYANPKICDPGLLRSVSKKLSKVIILCGDFSDTSKYAGPDTLYYLDPPYRPISKTASFTSYTANKFSDDEQVRLSEFVKYISGKGSYFIMSNSDPKNTDPDDEFFDDIYRDYRINRIHAARAINSDGKGRGAVSELLITSKN